LPAVPASVATITESDIDVGSFEIEHTPTEDLVTKMICNWWATGAQEEPNRVIMRHNVAKYGIQEETFDFYIYDNIDMVLKSATFWLIRNSNTWKIARFTTPLNLLNVETEDGVTLSFATPYISNGDITALVEEATYDSENRSIQFQCWTGVKAGQMDQYDFAYPADVDSTLTFPTPEEIAAGLDGGYGNNKAATGVLGTEELESRIKKVEYTSNISGRRRYQDKGLSKPSDTGDIGPGSPVTDTVPILSVAAPGPSSGQLYIAETEATVAASSGGLTQIDIHTTEIYDSETGKSCTLDTFFNKIDLAEGTSDPVLHGNTNAFWSNAGETTGYPFLFQVDTNLATYGAGLAFLFDDEEE
jgi:ribosomal protein S24E